MNQAKILLITKDLFFVPTLRAAAEQLNSQLIVALSPDSNEVTELSAAELAAWVVDLNCVPVDQISQCVAALRERFPNSKQIAYGPHVQESRMDAARLAGCDQVLSRGQLSGQIERLMRQWLAAS